MKIKIVNLLDWLFIILIFSSIVLNSSIVGKLAQFISMILIILICIPKKLKLNTYSVIDLLFVIYSLIQVLCGIAVYKESMNTVITVFYNSLFVFSIYSYCSTKERISDVIRIYASTTIISLLLLFPFYYKSLLDFRFSVSEIIKLGGLNLIGGHSSTALSLITAIPAFFLSCVTTKKTIKKDLLKIIILVLISFLTGTRKTLIIFALIFFVIFPLKYKKLTINNIIKMVIVFFLFSSVSLFMIMKIPMLYNIIGKRVENAITILVSDEDNSIDSSIMVRERLIDNAKKLYNERKISGWGLDYFRLSKQNDLGYYSHNNFYEILVGGGIIGFILYYLKYLYLIAMLIKSYIRDSQKSNKWFFLISFLIIMIIMEWWQITYIYRYIIIYQALMLSIIYQEKNFKVK